MAMVSVVAHMTSFELLCVFSIIGVVARLAALSHGWHADLTLCAVLLLHGIAGQAWIMPGLFYSLTDMSLAAYVLFLLTRAIAHLLLGASFCRIATACLTVVFRCSQLSTVPEGVLML